MTKSAPFRSGFRLAIPGTHGFPGFAQRGLHVSGFSLAATLVTGSPDMPSVLAVLSGSYQTGPDCLKMRSSQWLERMLIGGKISFRLGEPQEMVVARSADDGGHPGQSLQESRVRRFRGAAAA